jgi:hypothetical protein
VAVIPTEFITPTSRFHLIMGLAAPADSDPVAAEVNDETRRKDSQPTKDSQTASEYVRASDTIAVRLLSNIYLLATSTLNYSWKLKLAKFSHTYCSPEIHTRLPLTRTVLRYLHATTRAPSTDCLRMSNVQSTSCFRCASLYTRRRLLLLFNFMPQRTYPG